MRHCCREREVVEIMSDDGWHAQAIREANLLSYEATPDGDKIRVEGYGAMTREEFVRWLNQAKYLAGCD